MGVASAAAILKRFCDAIEKILEPLFPTVLVWYQNHINLVDLQQKEENGGWWKHSTATLINEAFQTWRVRAARLLTLASPPSVDQIP
jgi:hypothetical protein